MASGIKAIAKKIPVDFSGFSLAAASCAARLAKDMGAKPIFIEEPRSMRSTAARQNIRGMRSLFRFTGKRLIS
jgi:hypothetical protein